MTAPYPMLWFASEAGEVVELYPSLTPGSEVLRVQRFPEGTQPFIHLLPLPARNDGMRAVRNAGAGWEALPYPLLVLGVWGVLCYAAALRIFRWR